VYGIVNFGEQPWNILSLGSYKKKKLVLKVVNISYFLHAKSKLGWEKGGIGCLKKMIPLFSYVVLHHLK